MSVYQKSPLFALLPLLLFQLGDARADVAGERKIMQLGEPYRAEHQAKGEAASGKPRGENVAPYALEGLVYYDHGEPTDFEQLMLELVNRARMDPGAEASRLGIGLNDGLAPGTIADTPKPPLAPNRFLTDAARLHSLWMLDADVFSHSGEGGSSPSDRMSAASYNLSGTYTTGENIAASFTTSTVDLGQMTMEMHEGLFESPGHRTNICEAAFQELGIGIEEGAFYDQGTNWNAGMATQNFATSSATPGPFVTGVVYEDDNQNGSYDFGEGLEGVEVSLTGSGFYAQSSASGGYALPFDGSIGNQQVTFSGPGWEENVAVSLESGENLKVDLIVEEQALPWYDGASELQSEGWLYFDWFKGFKPEGPNWIFHGRHGWLYVLADDTSGIFLWDVAIGRWMFTSESVYPWMYAYGSNEGWLFFFEGGRPGSRYFKRGDNGQTVSEQNMSLIP